MKLKSAAIIALFFLSTVVNAKTFRSSQDSSWEGESSVTFEFDYSEKTFTVSVPKTKDRIVNIQEKNGKTHVLEVSFEGGRGFGPSDYLKEEKKCLACKEVATLVEIKGARNMKTFEDKKEVWILWNPPQTGGSGANSDWLFIAHLKKPTAKIAQVLRTLRFR